MTDTRKDKRAPISLKVRFKSATVDEFIEQYSKDISKGGIFIKSNKNSPPMPIGTLLKFEFQLKDESKLIQGVGRVVWKRELEGSSENDPAGMGIKFIKMDGESKSLVDQIVAGRGDTPGQYEAGGGTAAKDDELATGAGTTAPAEAGVKRPVRSAKATMQFFPSTTPQSELPKPEDRTQVRHASEFLASALSSAGVDEATTGEAERKAEEARQRTAEIEREREEQARKAREEEDKKARAERDRQEREKAEAEEKAAAAEKAAADKAAAEKAKAEKAAKADKPAAEPAKKSTSERPAAAAKTGSSSSTPPAAKKPEPKAAAPVAERPPAPAEPSSNLMPMVAAVLVVVAIGGWWFFGRGDGTTTTTTPPPPSSTTAAPPPPTSEAPPETTVAEGTPEEGTPEAPEATDVAVEPPPPAVTHDVRVESTPAAATIVVDGEERGAAPQTLALAEGEHTIEARLAGYATATSTVTSAEGVRPVRLTLTALPYRIHVVTTPAGARVRIGSRTVTAPADVTIPRPSSPIAAAATLAGYVDATQTLAPDAFVQGEDAMTADLSITLAPRPAAPPPTSRVRPPPSSTTTTTTTTPPPSSTTETPPPTTTAEEHHDAPPPSEAPPPPPPEEHHEATPPPASEAPPDNPF
ncbi:MAG: TIGR02266 family protein [Sandaracinus sp.]